MPSFVLADSVSTPAQSKGGFGFVLADTLLTSYPIPPRTVASFTVADSLRAPPIPVLPTNTAFTIADTPVTVLEIPEFSIASLIIADQTLIAETADQTQASFTVADTTIPAVQGMSGAVFVLADYNIIVTPSPEKLRVWDTVKQQWVHAPRYIWHADPGEWRQLS